MNSNTKDSHPAIVVRVVVKSFDPLYEDLVALPARHGISARANHLLHLAAIGREALKGLGRPMAGDAPVSVAFSSTPPPRKAVLSKTGNNIELPRAEEGDADFDFDS
jgi:hypothetical protein